MIALVAEDDPVVRMEAADILEDAGFDVLEASTARLALAHLEGRKEVTLLVTDVAMPGPMNGLALAHEARRRFPQMGIIVVSAHVPPKPDQMPEGARFLEKPYHANRLARVIREFDQNRAAG
nr:response regulator [Methylobacterium sp. L1A1]